MDPVGAALGDGGDDAAGGAAVFGRVDAGVDGELADGAAGGGISLAGAAAFLSAEGMVVVGAIDFNVVEQRADAANADEAEAAGVGNDARSGHGQGRPAAIVDGNVCERRSVQGGGEIGRLEVHDRGLLGDDDFGGG